MLVVVLSLDHVDQAVHAGLLVGQPDGAEVGGVGGREENPGHNRNCPEQDS